MNHAQFAAEALDILRNYWRIKAANAFNRSLQNEASGCLEYSNVPAVGFSQNCFNSEPLETVGAALDQFIVERLPRDFFLALIAVIESRIGTRLVSLGESSDGTLGALQNRIQAQLSLPQVLIEDFDEVRERRNIMIHHEDLANGRYVVAVNAVLPRSTSFVVPVVSGQRVHLTENYLAYAADVLVRYSCAVN